MKLGFFSSAQQWLSYPTLNWCTAETELLKLNKNNYQFNRRFQVLKYPHKIPRILIKNIHLPQPHTPHPPPQHRPPPPPLPPPPHRPQKRTLFLQTSKNSKIHYSTPNSEYPHTDQLIPEAGIMTSVLSLFEIPVNTETMVYKMRKLMTTIFWLGF